MVRSVLVDTRVRLPNISLRKVAGMTHRLGSMLFVVVQAIAHVFQILQNFN